MAALAVLLGISNSANGAVVFTDAFNRTNSSTIGNSWAEANPGGGDAAIASNMLDLLSNNGSDAGNSYITQSTSSFTGHWNNVMAFTPGEITWTFNMRSNNADLGGFDASQEAIAFVLVANGSDLETANGYAVVMGQAGTTDPLRLVSFTGGLDANANLTDILATTGAAGTPGDPGTNYLSVKVVYTSLTDTFELFARSDGASAFADPATGSYTSYGSATNSTYASITMSHIGMLGRYNQNNDSRLFDNVSVVVTPEPASFGLLGFAGLSLLSRRRRGL